MNFDCVYYYVSDLDQAVRFFSDTLGLELSSRDHVARFTIDGVLFELVPTTDASRYSGHGNARLCFGVQDMDGAIEDLNRKGVSVGPIHHVENGLLATFTDPDGNELALWQDA
jgi:predicted enzyme related to lactoylglutathione lyase